MGRAIFFTTVSFRKRMLTIGIIFLVSFFLILSNDWVIFFGNNVSPKDIRSEANLQSSTEITTRNHFNKMKSIQVHMSPSTSNSNDDGSGDGIDWVRVFENNVSAKDISNEANQTSTETTRDNFNKMESVQIPILPTTDDIQEERRSHLRQTCDRLGAKKHAEMLNSMDEHTLRKMDHIYYIDNYKLLFCYVPKAGCTSWKRILLVLQGIINSTMDISHEEVHRLGIKYLPVLGRQSLQEAKDKLAHYTKIVFVRDPFSRMLSAFRDKFEVNSYKNDAIKRTFAYKMVNSFRSFRNKAQKRVSTIRDNNGNINVTFGNFVDYVSDSWNLLISPAEEHWREMFRLCLPCYVPYDFIGHFETLAEDSHAILQQIDKNIQFPVSSNPTNSSNSALLNQYYSQLSSSQLYLLHKRLQADIEIFNYQVPAYIKTRMNHSFVIKGREARSFVNHTTKGPFLEEQGHSEGADILNNI